LLLVCKKIRKRDISHRLSSPTLNVIWAFINLSMFLTIFYFTKSSFTVTYGVIMMIGGFAMAVYLSRYFAN